METTSDPATIYRRTHWRQLMVLTDLKHSGPQSHFCRIQSVETLHPGLWITATFLDGSVQRFRPEKIRKATFEEQKAVSEWQQGGNCARDDVVEEKSTKQAATPDPEEIILAGLSDESRHIE